MEWVAFPPPGDLPNPGIKPASPALPGGFFTTEPPEKPLHGSYHLQIPSSLEGSLAYIPGAACTLIMGTREGSKNPFLQQSGICAAKMQT